MPALDSNTSAFINQVVTSLTVGPDLSGDGVLRGGPINFCKAQDLANVLRLLRDATGAGDEFLATEISTMMHGKNPFTEQYIGVYGEMRDCFDAFYKLLDFVEGTVPQTVMFTSVTLATTSMTDIPVNTRGTKLRIDELRGFNVSIDGVKRTIVKNTEDGVITLDKALTAAPDAGDAVIVSLDFDHVSTARPGVYIGGQPGENYRLAGLITAARDAVVAYEIPEEEEEEEP